MTKVNDSLTASTYSPLKVQYYSSSSVYCSLIRGWQLLAGTSIHVIHHLAFVTHAFCVQYIYHSKFIEGLDSGKAKNVPN